MVGPVGGISVLDGVGALIRVGVAARAAPSSRAIEPVSPIERGAKDTVELSPEAQRRQVAAGAAQVEREARTELNGQKKDETDAAEPADSSPQILDLIERARAEGEPGPVLLDVLA